MSKGLQTNRKFANYDFGAVEHGNSSFYYLPYQGYKNYTSYLSDAVMHEFMHIHTPLNLHSELIGSFNFKVPEMSKHLSLYEGITEYFSSQIKMQGKIIDFENLLKYELKEKIVNA